MSKEGKKQNKAKLPVPRCGWLLGKAQTSPPADSHSDRTCTLSWASFLEIMKLQPRPGPLQWKSASTGLSHKLQRQKTTVAVFGGIPWPIGS